MTTTNPTVTPAGTGDTGHLTLSRRVGERLHLHLPTGETIVVEVRQIQQNSVRIGITAPQSVKVLRSEIDHEEVRS